jgi:muramoyltetrapeptide carboxypeptidase
MKAKGIRTLDGYVRPPRLRSGDSVAVVAPSSPLKRGQMEVVERSLRVLEAWGLQHCMARGIRERRGYLAGSDDTRAAQLEWAFLNDEIRGIFCLRGGYGSARLLPRLRPELLREHPKVLVGFSDPTVLLLHLLQAGGMVTFHGPTLTSGPLAEGPDTPTARSLRRAVMDGVAQEPIPGEIWVRGTAEGPLVGGCLSMLASVVGTPYAPVARNAVLFLEDVSEPPYRIDRMLWQLQLSGMLGSIRGVVLGEVIGSTRKGREGDLRRAILDVLGPLGVPILFGIPCGHGRVNLTLPLGCRVLLDGEAGLLRFLEAGVR